MRTPLSSTLLLLSCASLVALLAGCPKRPVPTVASAPAPPASASSAAPAAPAPAPEAPAPPPPPAVTPAPAHAPATPVLNEYRANAALKDIHFDFDRSTIRPGDQRILAASAAYLKAHPDQLVLVEGHCDERGTAEYNLALGERRARAAMTNLVERGIDTDRITIISYGKERPVCTERTPPCWARNRSDRFLTKAR